MATYEEIRQDIRKRHGRVMKSCWIAHVKALNGLNPRPAPNRQSLKTRVYPCPSVEREWIEASMRRFGMLPRLPGDRA